MVSNMSLKIRVIEESLRMKMFPYTMKDKAKDMAQWFEAGSLSS